MSVLFVLIFIAFDFVWYFPVYRRQGLTDRLPRRTVPVSILVGLIPVFLASIFVQFGGGFLRRAIPFSEVANLALDSYFDAALVEELMKFLGAYLIVRKVCPKRKVDYVLIFGAVGLGFEVTESLLLMDSAIAALGRGVFALHIIWQFFMGMFFWEYRQAKQLGDRHGVRKNLCLAFGVPIVLHGTNDFLAFMAERALNTLDAAAPETLEAVEALAPETEAAGVWMLLLLIFLVVQIVFQIVTFKMALKTAKESRRLDNAPNGEEQDSAETPEA